MLAVLKLENTTGGAYYHSNVITRAPTSSQSQIKSVHAATIIELASKDAPIAQVVIDEECAAPELSLGSKQRRRTRTRPSQRVQSSELELVKRNSYYGTLKRNISKRRVDCVECRQEI